MKVLILRSVRDGSVAPGPYTLRADTSFAERLLAHLTDRAGYCGACGDDCTDCRSGHDLDLGEAIADVIDFPSILPVMIDNPAEFLPRSVTPHDVTLAVGVNEELVAAFLRRFPVARGVVVPIEGSSWLSPHGKQTISDICSERGIEVAFPKPFCSLASEAGVLAEFSRTLRIGTPRIGYATANGVITRAEVAVSAPCGATYFLARALEGRSIDDDLTFIADKCLSSYPCTADRSVDPEFRDSIIHRAVQVQRTGLSPLETA